MSQSDVTEHRIHSFSRAVQVSAAKVKLRALEETGLPDEIHIQAATLARLASELAAASAAHSAAAAVEAAASERAAAAAEAGQQSDEKAERLRMTAESLAQGVAQMAAVRQQRGDAADLRARSAQLKELCEAKRKEAKRVHSNVRSRGCLACSWRGGCACV